MTFKAIMDECWKKSADPRFPGLGKDPKLGLLLGVTLGAIGVGIYLRSWVDGLLALLGCTLLSMFSDSIVMTPLCWALWGCWVMGRIKLSTRRYQTLKSASQRAAPTEPASGVSESTAAGSGEVLVA